MLRWLIVLLLFAGPVMAQDDWTMPQPEIDISDPEKYKCKEKELVYKPVASYRISGTCKITDIRSVGDYKYGIQQVKSDIPGFQSSRTVKRFIAGESVYRKEIRIELHRALEDAATLVCETDMMDSEVFKAKIIRTRETQDGREVEREEPVNIDDGKLEDPGIFTHSREITTMTNRCNGQ